jgi:hypothetical protein
LIKRLLAGGAKKSMARALTVAEMSRLTVDPLLMRATN